jgi:FdhE protein
MQNHAQYFNERAKRLVETGLLDSTLADFYTALYGYQHREYERFHNSSRVLSLAADGEPADAIRNKLSEEGIMDLISPGIDGLLDIMIQHHPGLALQQLRRSIREEPGAGNRYIEALLDKNFEMIEQLSQKDKTGTEETVFVLVNWLKPFFIAMREHNRELIPKGESGTDCPFCGYYADMAALNGNENGKRHLHCSLCEHLWPFKRVACSVCGAVEAGSLEYFTIEGEEAYRIDTCNKCGGYIKTVRFDKFEDIDNLDLTVENIITPHLDSAALRKGYRRP